jgi:hypothetical protein
MISGLRAFLLRGEVPNGERKSGVCVRDSENGKRRKREFPFRIRSELHNGNPLAARDGDQQLLLRISNDEKGEAL